MGMIGDPDSAAVADMPDELQEALRIEGLSRGADDYMSKPFDPLTLARDVSGALGWDA